jgi:hypothetical protein
MITVLAALAFTGLAEWKLLQCEGQERITGRYLNYSRAFSVGIPKEFPARRSAAGGPDVGVPIPLSPDCTSVIVVFATPNSLEWASPREAIEWEFHADSDNVGLTPTVYHACLGRLRAAAVTAHHIDSEDVEVVVIAFGPDTGLIYEARLATTSARFKADCRVFDRVLKSFRTEPWR